MHLKNFSLISREGKVELAPAYDFLSTTVAFLAIGKKLPDIEEIALPLGGKKRKLTRSMWLDYFARERLGLNPRIIAGCLQELRDGLPECRLLLDRCFLSADQKTIYGDLLSSRCRLLGL
jgi:serine/threonine-protein kinase HipA